MTDERAGWLWLLGALPAVVADCHHRHGLDWHQLEAGTALELAGLFLATPGTYTHATVAVPEQERLLVERLEQNRQERHQPAQAPRGGPAGPMRRYEARNLGADATVTEDVAVDDRWRRLAEQNGITL